MTAGFGAVFVLLAAHDIVYRVIPNRVVYPAGLLALALSWAWEGRGPVDALIGGAVAFAGLAVLRWLTRGGLGGGDLKMAGVVGLVVGYSNLPLAASVMVLAGGVSALALLAIGRLSRRGSIAYGPFIALGGLAVALLCEGTAPRSKTDAIQVADARGYLGCGVRLSGLKLAAKRQTLQSNSVLDWSIY